MKDIGMIAALAAILGSRRSPEELFFATKEFSPDPKTAEAFSSILEKLNGIDPANVDSFIFTVVHRQPDGGTPQPCPDCGGTHEGNGLVNDAGVAGEETAIMAQLSLLVEKSGLREAAQRG